MFLKIDYMQIRTRLTLQFLLLGGIIMIAASVAIYFSSSRFHRDDFNDLLRSRARNITQVVLDSYEYNADRALRSGIYHLDKLQDEKIIILDSNTDTIYLSDKNWKLPEINSMISRIKPDEDVSVRSDQYSVLGTLFTSGSYRFIVIAGAIDRDGPVRLRQLRILLLIVCLASLLLFFIAGWFYSGRALKPISDMVKKVEDITITSLHLRVPEGNGTDEIGHLAKTFNRMLERLEKSFGMQKSFIANASHELRTPLTSINGQIEVLMMKDRSAQEYKAALGSVLEDIKSLTDLTNKLLLMARTSAEAPVSFNNEVRVDELIWETREEMAGMSIHYNVNISIDDELTDSEQMTVKGDEYLLKIALSNLIDNACKYSSDHSVDINISHTGKWLEVIFADKGVGIPEEEIQKVFEPFYRGKNVMGLQGVGVGLSLVKQIINNHNGTIKLSSVPGEGTIVVIRLPSVK